MKKLGLFICLSVAAFTASAQSGARFETGESQTQNKRVSPNGKWLVGESTKMQTWGEEGVMGYASFLQNVETGERTWLTTFDGGDYNMTGSFTDVTDDGVICGVMKDPDNTVTWQDWEGIYTLPLNVAAIWQKDGTLTKLGLGTYKADDFVQLSDGTYATAISNDAKTVVGFVSTANFATVHPVGWKWNEDTQTYDFKEYVLPEGYKLGRINDVSADGSIAVGYIKHKDATAITACFWTSPDKCVIIENTKPIGGVQNDGQCFVVSGDGRFIGATLSGMEPARIVVTDYSTGEYQIKYIGLHEGYSEVTVDGITDDGQMIGKYRYPVTGQQRPYFYNREQNVDFDYFIYANARDIQDDIPFTFTHYDYESVSFSGMSADGSVIVGNDIYTAPWVLTTPFNMNLWTFTIPEGMTGRATALGKVTVTAPKTILDPYIFYNVYEYVLYRNGKEVKRVAKADLEDGYTTVEFEDENVPRGANYYSVAVNYYDTRNEEYVLSPRCDEIVVNMDANFDFPLFDDFETGSITSQGWWVDKHFGDTAAMFAGCGQYFGLRTTNFLNLTVFQSQPYSYACVSRHLDATDKESVYMSFARYWIYVNQYDWDLTKDVVSVEVSVDDKNWTSVKDLRASEIDPYCWGFENIDLTPYVAGKVFQVRLHAHGEALSQVNWRIDDVRIDEKPQHDAVSGVKGINIPDDGFRLTWKNPTLDAYGLNYYGNMMYNVEHKLLGNEGEELICINKFDGNDLFMYADKWITSVSTEFAYYDDALTPLRAAIVVYENGKLVREQEIADPQYNIYATYKLDEPLQIKAGNEIWVGLKLIDYDPSQMPIRYQNTSDFVDGKSNIYSEDGGKTWLNLADYYETIPEHETDGYASWQFTTNVSDTKEMASDKIDISFYAIEVYKNGEKMRDLFVDALQGWITDPESKIGDTYQVVSYYLNDGTCSAISAEFENDGTIAAGVDCVKVTDNKGYMLSGDTLYINGDNRKVSLYDASGVMLYDGNAASLSMRGFGRGLYILKVYGNDDSEQTHKLLF